MTLHSDRECLKLVAVNLYLLQIHLALRKVKHLDCLSSFSLEGKSCAAFGFCSIEHCAPYIAFKVRTARSC